MLLSEKEIRELPHDQKLLLDKSPFYWYDPLGHQRAFHESQARFRWAFGGNRSGKTRATVQDNIWYGLDKHPWRTREPGPIEIWVIAKDFPTARDVLEPYYRQLLGSYWVKKWYNQDHICVMKNGTKLTFKSAESGWEKFQGKAIHRASLDEHIPFAIYKELQARIVDYKGDIISSETPTEGMTWEYDEIYEKWLAGESPDTECFFFKTYDNEYLDRDEVDRLRDQFEDEDECAMRLEGKFVEFAGMVYKEFDRNVHVINDVAIPGCTLYRGIDHGLNNPTACVFMLVDKDDIHYIVGEYYFRERTVKENATEIKRLTNEICKKHKVSKVTSTIIDPSTKNRSPLDFRSVWLEYIQNGVPCMLGNNEVEAGIDACKNRLKVNKTTGRAGVYVFKSCKNFIYEINRYIRDVYKHNSEDKNLKERPKKVNDHLMDAWRYVEILRPKFQAGLVSGGYTRSIDSSIKRPKWRDGLGAANKRR